jgi:glutathione reductase (NADPH)
MLSVYQIFPSCVSTELTTRLGGGSGGVRASRMASNAGARVGLCEMPYDPVSTETTGGLGGTCVIRGCVPKKLFVYGSEFAAGFQDAEGFGWVMDNVKLDWKHLLDAKQKEIQRLNGIYERLLAGSGVHTHEGSGKLIDRHTVEITNAQVRCVFMLHLYFNLSHDPRVEESA